MKVYLRPGFSPSGYSGFFIVSVRSGRLLGFTLDIPSALVLCRIFKYTVVEVPVV